MPSRAASESAGRTDVLFEEFEREKRVLVGAVEERVGLHEDAVVDLDRVPPSAVRAEDAIWGS
jgi:hypothetical protein